MAWSGQFIESLGFPSQSYEWLLRFLGGSNDYFVGVAGTISSHGKLRIAAEGPTLQGTRVVPQRWAVSFGGFDVPVVGDISNVSGGMLRKGAIAELRVRINGGAYERLAFGQLRAVTGVRGRYRLTFVDMIGMLSTRLSTNLDELSFFYNAGKTATITATHTASATNLLVDDVTIFDKDSNEDGLVKIIDSINSREDFWRWSSKVVTSGTAGYLVISAHGNWPQQLSGGYNTVGINQTAMSVARLQGRPEYEFLRMLMSTGSGTQGSFDDFPKSWGSGYDFDPNIIDLDDLNAQRSIFNTSSGSYEIAVVVESPPSSGIRFLMDKFAQIGMWPIMRQGKITWRACQDPDAARATAANINDSGIIAILDHELYSSQQSVVYGKTTIHTGAQKASASDDDIINNQSVTINTIKTFPANNELIRDNRFIYRLDSPVQADKATADLARMKRWDFESYELLTLHVVPRFATLCAGDIVSITSNYLIGFSETRSYKTRRGMVVGTSWNPQASRCILSVAILPL